MKETIATSLIESIDTIGSSVTNMKAVLNLMTFDNNLTGLKMEELQAALNIVYENVVNIEGTQEALHEALGAVSSIAR